MRIPDMAEQLAFGGGACSNSGPQRPVMSLAMGWRMSQTESVSRGTQLKVQGPRKRPMQERSKQLVSAILTAAANTFDREGLTATTNRVAEAAGVSIGSLYQYFPNKQSLLVALAQRHTEATTAAMDEILAGQSNYPSLRILIERMIHAVLREHRSHPHLRALMRTVGASAPEIQEQFEHCIAQAQQAIVLQMQGQYPEKPNPQLRARLMAAAVDGVIHNPVGYEFDDALEAELIELCVSYLEHN